MFLKQKLNIFFLHNMARLLVGYKHIQVINITPSRTGCLDLSEEFVIFINSSILNTQPQHALRQWSTMLPSQQLNAKQKWSIYHLFKVF